MITLPALSSVDDILDTDLILVEHSTGEGFKMTGADLKALMKAQAVDTVALNNMQSVTSNAVAVELNTVANELALRLKTYEQSWGTPHTYSLLPDSTYILFCQNPNVFATDIWLIKSRHSTNASLTGYCQIIMKGTNSPDYNIGITGDTLTIGRECITSLIKINLIYG